MIKKKHYLLASGNGNLLFSDGLFLFVVFIGCWIWEGVDPTGFSWLCGCIFFGIFFVVPILGVPWVLPVDKGDLDLGLWCVLDVGEDLRNCDNTGLCEGIGLCKGFGYDDEICCWEANFGFGGADRWMAKYMKKKLQFWFK